MPDHEINIWPQGSLCFVLFFSPLSKVNIDKLPRLSKEVETLVDVILNIRATRPVL